MHHPPCTDRLHRLLQQCATPAAAAMIQYCGEIDAVLVAAMMTLMVKIKVTLATFDADSEGRQEVNPHWCHFSIPPGLPMNEDGMIMNIALALKEFGAEIAHFKFKKDGNGFSTMRPNVSFKPIGGEVKDVWTFQSVFQGRRGWRMAGGGFLHFEPGKDILAMYKICEECHLPKMGNGYSGPGLDQYVQACASGIAGPSAGGSSSSSSRPRLYCPGCKDNRRGSKRPAPAQERADKNRAMAEARLAKAAAFQAARRR